MSCAAKVMLIFSALCCHFTSFHLFLVHFYSFAAHKQYKRTDFYFQSRLLSSGKYICVSDTLALKKICQDVVIAKMSSVNS